VEHFVQRKSVDQIRCSLASLGYHKFEDPGMPQERNEPILISLKCPTRCSQIMELIIQQAFIGGLEHYPPRGFPIQKPSALG